jgi:hypothetical protein
MFETDENIKSGILVIKEKESAWSMGLRIALFT